VRTSETSWWSRILNALEHSLVAVIEVLCTAKDRTDDWFINAIVQWITSPDEDGFPGQFPLPEMSVKEWRQIIDTGLTDEWRIFVWDSISGIQVDVLSDLTRDTWDDADPDLVKQLAIAQDVEHQSATRATIAARLPSVILQWIIPINKQEFAEQNMQEIDSTNINYRRRIQYPEPLDTAFTREMAPRDIGLQVILMIERLAMRIDHLMGVIAAAQIELQNLKEKKEALTKQRDTLKTTILMEQRVRKAVDDQWKENQSISYEIKVLEKSQERLRSPSFAPRISAPRPNFFLPENSTPSRNQLGHPRCHSGKRKSIEGGNEGPATKKFLPGAQSPHATPAPGTLDQSPSNSNRADHRLSSAAPTGDLDESLAQDYSDFFGQAEADYMAFDHMEGYL